jgi:hypothetical protein
MIMPGFDRTGPQGMGPMTGGGRGFCRGGPAGRPGYVDWGGHGGRGRGRGWGRAYFGPARIGPAAPDAEADYLRAEADMLRERLSRVEDQLARLNPSSEED